MAARKKTPDLKDEALKYAPEAIEALVELMRNSGSDPVRVAAALPAKYPGQEDTRWQRTIS